MVKFLINKPIAVTMVFVAILSLGIVSLTKLPVSLMPDIAIPEITVQVSGENMAARELENSVVSRLRSQLMQVAHLADVHSETRDGSAIIELNFEYGTDVDYAFIEVNEKIDRAMNYLSGTIDRPRVMKASAGDIPVFYLNLSLRDKGNAVNDTSHIRYDTSANELFPVSYSFVEMCRFASNVISRRIEQLPEVAMVDKSGVANTELLVIPDMEKTAALGVSIEQIENAIHENNLQLGNLSIKDGQYVYNVRFEAELLSKQDIGNIYLKSGTRMFQLRDVAEVLEHPQKLKGKVLFNGKDAVSMAIIKQSDAKMKSLKSSLHHLVAQFEIDYPDIQFEITRDQTQLLDYSISNLLQSLMWGALFAFLVMFFFLRDFKSPFLIGITIPLSLIVALLFFHLTGLTLNIISLSGLILGVGMMIDNSIIVIDNITQHFQRLQVSGLPREIPKGNISPGVQVSSSKFQVSGSALSGDKQARSDNKLLMKACVSGTNEVIRPMLSAVLTTCAVFIPLIFIRGIAGALFYDQAMAITIGLFASLAVSVTILPVYYKLFYQRGAHMGRNRILNRFNTINYEKVYERGFRFVMRNQLWTWLVVIVLLLGAVALYYGLPKTKLPVLEKDEMLVSVDWNERIHVEENNNRVIRLLSELSDYTAQSTGMIAEQQFLLDKTLNGSASEAVMYFKAKDAALLDSIWIKLDACISMAYPEAKFSFDDAGNIFNVIFSDDEPGLVARLRATSDFGRQYNQQLKNIHGEIQKNVINQHIPPISWQEHTVLNASPEKMLLYDVSYNNLYRQLKSMFSENMVMQLNNNSDFVPVVIGGKPQSINEVLETSMVRNSKGNPIPVRELLSRETGFGLKTIVAGREGEYYPIILQAGKQNAEGVMKNIRETVNRVGGFEVSFSGSIFSNREMIRQMVLVLLISLALLYFILAAQFESVTLPLIVLAEVPIDIFGAFLFLKLFGAGINLMSLIGIIVMCGIIINDSILKIDTINQLRNQGYSLMKALVVAGQRRLKPILMTSVTTILALLPFLFTHGLGADLQKPLALAVIGGMLVGTLVSLYFIPLGYYYLKPPNPLKGGDLSACKE
ncbi:MAG: efflux RND transporter permease subunit [Prolixibacteraceae bacterium]|nr:efflux RND transporter permease subunit [Prolixibacteraceae bacterium]